MLLAVLASPAQFTVYEVSFPANISHDRGISIASFVGTGNTLFPGFRVVAGSHVNIHRDKTAWKP